MVMVCLVPSSGGEGLPLVEITSEDGLISGTYALNVTVSGDLEAGEVYYGVDEDDPTTKMTDKGGGAYQASIDVDSLTEGPHTIYVKAINSTGSSTVISINVDVDRNSPQVVLTSAGGDASGDFLVTATVEDPYLNQSAVYFVVDDDLEASRDYVLTRVDDHFEILFDTTVLPDGDHSIRIWAFDIWGSFNKSHGEGMVVDNTPPVIEITSEGGMQSETYILRVTVTEPNLLALSVNVTVGDDEPMGMDREGEEFIWNVDTTAHPNGDLVLKVDAADAFGHTASETITITIDNKADLVITDVEWSDDAIKDGKYLKATVTVRNDGSVDAVGFKIVVTEDGEVLATTEVTDPLEPGASTNYPVDWTVQGAGKRTFSVEVDPDDAVPEVNEDDNVWPETQEVKVTKQGEDSPGPGAILATSALLLALLVIWRRRA
jgi:hypothetical protein